MAWVHGVLALVCLVIGGLHLVRLGTLRRGRVLEAGYAAMAVGMAGMFSPWGDPVPASAWTAVFLIGLAWFGGILLRARSVTALHGEALHLAVGSAAMLFMLGADHRAAAVGGAHPAHASDAPGLAGVASAVALVFAAYFVLHALRCADRLRWTSGRSRARRAATAAGGQTDAGALAGVAVAAPAPGRLRAVGAAGGARWVSGVAHLTMTSAMAVMLVAMI